METLFDQNQLSRLLMTVVTLLMCIGPAVADFNKTHAVNPLWVGHARFHVVWQVLTNSSNSILMLFLLWIPFVQYDFQLKIVAILISIFVISFFVTVFTRHWFGGTLKDENGIKPYRFKLPGRTIEVDTNLFGVILNILLLGFAVVNISA